EDIAHEVGLQAVTSPTRTSPIHGLGEWRRFFSETVRIAAGKIFGYGRLDRHRQVERLVPGLATQSDHLRGGCDRQHDRVWPCYWGFESSPPSSHNLLAPFV